MRSPGPWLSFVILWAIRLLGRMVRLRVVDRCGLLSGQAPRPLIWAFWHNRILAVVMAKDRFVHGRYGAVLTSASRDGELLAAVMARFGVDAVRGSSSRRGSTALRELIALLRSGRDAVITPDGPRGPRYRLAAGTISLAQWTRAAVMPVHVSYSRYWELRSWDRFRIPKPGSRVTITFGPLWTVGEEEEPEAARLRLESLLGGD